MSDAGDYEDFYDDSGSEYSDDGGHVTDEDEEDLEKDEEENEEEDEDDDEGIMVDDDIMITQEDEPNIDPEVNEWNTYQFLTDWEVTRLLTNRSQQIQTSAEIYVEPIDDEMPYQTAIRELFERKIPLKIQRIDVSTGKVLYEIDPNEINPRTGKRWFLEEEFRNNMF